MAELVYKDPDDGQMKTLRVASHADLDNLAADSHLQYHNDARGDARYSSLSHNHNEMYDAPTAGTAELAVHVAQTNPHPGMMLRSGGSWGDFWFSTTVGTGRLIGLPTPTAATHAIPYGYFKGGYGAVGSVTLNDSSTKSFSNWSLVNAYPKSVQTFIWYEVEVTMPAAPAAAVYVLTGRVNGGTVVSHVFGLGQVVANAAVIGRTAYALTQGASATDTISIGLQRYGGGTASDTATGKVWTTRFT